MTDEERGRIQDLVDDLRHDGVPAIMTIDKAAETLGMSRYQVYRYASSGLLPTQRIGNSRGLLRVTIRGLATFILQSGQQEQENQQNEQEQE